MLLLALCTFSCCWLRELSHCSAAVTDRQHVMAENVVKPCDPFLSTSCSCGGEAHTGCTVHNHSSCSKCPPSAWTRLTSDVKLSPWWTWLSRYEACSIHLNAIRSLHTRTSVASTFSFMPRHARKYLGVYTILCSTRGGNCRPRCLSPAATLALDVHGTDTTYSQAQYAMLLSESRPVAEEVWRVLADGLSCAVSSIIILIPQSGSSAASKCMRHECDCFC
jgi:hypothetical protein